MSFEAQHVRAAFDHIRRNGLGDNRDSIKWDIIDPETQDRFPPKAVLRIAKSLAHDESPSGGGGWPTNDPLRARGFQIVLKQVLETSGELEDLDEIAKQDVPDTVRRQLVNARLGQGSFRAALLEKWNGRCAISNCTIEAVLRASHIKAWRDSSNYERLNLDNGILLAASIDALFDRYLISFNGIGQALVCHSISSAVQSLDSSNWQRLNIDEQMKVYLVSHRERFAKLSKSRAEKPKASSATGTLSPDSPRRSKLGLGKSRLA